MGPGKDRAENEFLILEVRHTVSNNYETRQGSKAEYQNRLVCIRKKIPWRPGRGFNSTEPKIYGLQTATVVGPEGEEVHTDQYGRVRVQFHWDREGEYNENSSAFVRVASNLAGANFGDVTLPRATQEVIVQYLDGNPDRPLITGRVYNAMNMPPRFSHTGGLPGNRYLSGIKTKEVNGNRYNQMRLDDTPGQISAQFASEHAHSQVNLGHLTHPRNEGTGKPRGDGFELRTDDSGSIRTAKSLLISAWKRLDASGNQLSSEEHLALMQDCLDLFKSLGEYAAQHQALAIDDKGQAELREDVKAAAAGSNIDPNGLGGKPTISVTAPDGVAFTTPKTVVTYAGLNIDTVAQQHMQLTAGQRYNLNAGKGISLFAHKNGITQIAHYGRFLIQSQHDDTEINAAKNIKWTATEGNIVGMAREIHLIAEDGSFIRIGGGITLGTKGVIQHHGADFLFDEPATMATALPTFDGSTPDQKFVLKYNPDRDGGIIAPHSHYEIAMSDGSTHAGISDAEGKTTILARDAMHIANVRLLQNKS